VTTIRQLQNPNDNKLSDEKYQCGYKRLSANADC